MADLNGHELRQVPQIGHNASELLASPSSCVPETTSIGFRPCLDTPCCPLVSSLTVLYPLRSFLRRRYSLLQLTHGWFQGFEDNNPRWSMHRFITSRRRLNGCSQRAQDH